MGYDKDQGDLLYKTSCDSCGSSDANAIYSSGTSFCFSCHNWSVVDGDARPSRKVIKVRGMLEGEHIGLKARGIPLEICRQYNYMIVEDKKGTKCQAATYYNKNKQPVAQKLRYKNKDMVWVGKAKDVLLFGQQAFSSGGMKLTITEGELDAMSVATAFEGRYPVVSISHGAATAKKVIASQLEWISSFDEIIIWFDNDEAGLKAVEAVTSILPLEKVKIINHPDYKDANEVLQNIGKGGVLKTFYNAEPYEPDGFVTIDDNIIEEALKPIEWGIPWMYEYLTNVSYGRRYGEVVALGAGVSVGKTDFLMQQIAYDLKEGRQVATFMLEQNKTETLLRVAGKVDGKFYHLPDAEYDKAKLKDTLLLLRDQGLHIYDNFGRIDWETIKGKIRSATYSYGCKLFYIDNLTALNAHADDERRNLDALMEEIASLAKELDIWILVVSHLNPPKKGASHETGGRVEQAQFTGSRAIMRWAQFMVGIERNITHELPDERVKGIVRVIKDRFSGKATGTTTSFVYDMGTGMTSEAEEGFAIEAQETEEDY